MKGKFFIINVGPGEKDNITLKAYKILTGADVVIASERQCERFREELEKKIIIDGGHRLFRDKSIPNNLVSESNLYKEGYIRKKIYEYFNEGKTIALIESGDTAIFSPYRGYLTEFSDLNPILIPGMSSFNAANALLGKAVLTDKSQYLWVSALDKIMEIDGTELPDFWVLFCMHLDLPKLIERIQYLYHEDKDVSFVLRAGYKNGEVIRTKVKDLQKFKTIKIDWPYCLIYIGI